MQAVKLDFEQILLFRCIYYSSLERYAKISKLQFKFALDETRGEQRDATKTALFALLSTNFKHL